MAAKKNGNPQALTGTETRARWMKTLVEFINMFAEQSCHRRTEDARKLGLQQITQRAAEGLAFGGIIGMPACGRTLVHTFRPHFLPVFSVFSAGWTRSQI